MENCLKKDLSLSEPKTHPPTVTQNCEDSGHGAAGDLQTANHHSPTERALPASETPAELARDKVCDTCGEQYEKMFRCRCGILVCMGHAHVMETEMVCGRCVDEIMEEQGWR